MCMNSQELTELSNLRILLNLPIDLSIQILEYFPVSIPFLCMQWYFRFPRGLWTNFNGPFSIFGMQFLQIWNWCFVLLSHFSFKQGFEQDLVSGLKKTKCRNLTIRNSIVVALHFSQLHTFFFRYFGFDIILTFFHNLSKKCTPTHLIHHH